jgi:hypothetical protein
VCQAGLLDGVLGGLVVGAEGEAGVVGADPAGVEEVPGAGVLGGVDDVAVLLHPVGVLAGDQHDLVVPGDGVADLCGVAELDPGGTEPLGRVGVEDLLVAARGGDGARCETGLLQLGEQQAAECAGGTENDDGHGNASPGQRWMPSTWASAGWFEGGRGA